MNLRWLNPKTNPALYAALLGVAYAIWQAITAAQATGPLTWARAGHIAAGVVFAAAASWVRGKVTPVADPRDGNGKPLYPGLRPLPPGAAVTIPSPVSSTAPPGVKVTYHGIDPPIPPRPEGTT